MARGIKPHLRRRGEKRRKCKRGRPRRWVVERANSWHNNFRVITSYSIHYTKLYEHLDVMKLDELLESEAYERGVDLLERIVAMLTKLIDP